MHTPTNSLYALFSPPYFEETLEREKLSTPTLKDFTALWLLTIFPTQSSLFYSIAPPRPCPPHRRDVASFSFSSANLFLFFSTASHLWHGEHVCRVFHYIESVARPQCKWAPAWSIMLIASETLITVISCLEPWQLVSARFPGSLWVQFNNRPLLAGSYLHCAGV